MCLPGRQQKKNPGQENNYLQKILAVVEEAKPDLLISTGDLVDGQLNNLTEEAKMLAAVRPRMGKIAITGNHEFLNGNLRSDIGAGDGGSSRSTVCLKNIAIDPQCFFVQLFQIEHGP